MTYPGTAKNLPHTFRCRNHPEREGVGICVSCRSVVCVECSTKIDRMNYCTRCLKSEAQPARGAGRDNAAAERALGIPLLILSFVVAAGIFTLLGILLATLRQATGGGVTAG
jgi:hypothetical protein